MIGCLVNSGLLRMQLAVLLLYTCLHVSSRILPGYSEANYEKYLLEYPVLVPGYEHKTTLLFLPFVTLILLRSGLAQSG
jgi:hypothetical protein